MKTVSHLPVIGIAAGLILCISQPSLGQVAAPLKPLPAPGVVPVLPHLVAPVKPLSVGPVRLRGFVDLHTHPLANIAFGGKLFYGGMDIGAILPADPNCVQTIWSNPAQYVRATSEDQALGPDKSTHGGYDFFSNGCGNTARAAIIHLLQAPPAFDPIENARGCCDFYYWPVWYDITHQKMWVDWMHRAYLGGLRVMVALAVNNQTLGGLTTTNTAGALLQGGVADGPVDDKTSADLQISEIEGFVGRHSDFMQVAYTPADVFQIVSANKLAVVVGIEVDQIGNFSMKAPPSDADVRAEIDRLYSEGVRYIFPIHLIDNAFGGSAAYNDMFVVSSYLINGRIPNLVCANPSAPADINIRYTFNFNPAANLLNSLAGITGLPNGPELANAANMITAPHCPIGQRNSLGLLPAGVTAINEMMRLGMLIDIDHMSQAATDAALGIATGTPPNLLGYPLNSGHNAVRSDVDNVTAHRPAGQTKTNRYERGMRPDQYATIGKLHGMAGVGSAGLDAAEWLQMYTDVVYAMGGPATAVAGFGTDTNGLEMGMPPRVGSCVQYTDQPPRTDCIVQLTPIVRSTDHTKTWDYNVDGVAQYGMLWDFLMDVSSLPNGANMVNNNLMYGADYFFRTWLIAATKSANVTAAATSVGPLKLPLQAIILSQSSTAYGAPSTAVVQAIDPYGNDIPATVTISAIYEKLPPVIGKPGYDYAATVVGATHQNITFLNKCGGLGVSLPQGLIPQTTQTHSAGTGGATTTYVPRACYVTVSARSYRDGYLDVPYAMTGISPLKGANPTQ
jgi:hypothetical protein